MRRPSNPLIVALPGLLALLSGPAARARSSRPAPSTETVVQARQLHRRAQNLRNLRVPLRSRRATRHLSWAYSKLQSLGVPVDRSAPVVLDTSQEYRLLRQVSSMLRGARKGSAAYRLRRQAVTRAFQLHREMYKLPRGMRAYTSVHGKQGRPELVLNLDSSFYNKPARLLPLIAHEHRHLRDIGRAQRLEAVLAQPELRNAKPGTRQHQRKQRLQAKVDALMSSDKAETRAFHTQARTLGLAGWSLGNWWRSIQNTPIDAIYPPEKLNRALIKGYMQGITQRIGKAMRDAEPGQRELAARYLKGYKNVLKSQAGAYFEMARRDGRQSPALLERYKADRARALEQAQHVQGGKNLTPEGAFLAGQADAYTGAAPRAGQILGMP